MSGEQNVGCKCWKELGLHGKQECPERQRRKRQAKEKAEDKVGTSVEQGVSGDQKAQRQIPQQKRKPQMYMLQRSIFWLKTRIVRGGAQILR